MRNPYEDVAAARLRRLTEETHPADEWKLSAKCDNYPTTLFYTGEASRGDNPTIVALCKACPVQRECLLDEFRTAAQAGDLHGYRAGMPLNRRIRAYKQWRAAEGLPQSTRGGFNQRKPKKKRTEP